ncbi:MAG: TIM barrel protein [Verrucomicrobiota bacterium]
MKRRHFLSSALLAAGGASLTYAQTPSRAAVSDFPVGAFVKFLQSQTYSEMADTMDELGFQGIEATIRKKGQIVPEKVEEELPKLVAALKAKNQQIIIMASDVTRADDPLMEKTLRVAADLGIQHYRMGHYRYDPKKELKPQLIEYRAMARELAALNKELGLSGLFQNHSGARYVGAPVWDLETVLDGIDPDHIGVAFDIRHATAEGGLSWPLHWSMILPRVRAVYVKDFVWEGRRPKNVPLGSGQVDPAFFQKHLPRIKRTVPISLHIEYLRTAGVEKNIEALRNDLATLKKLLTQ